MRLKINGVKINENNQNKALFSEYSDLVSVKIIEEYRIGVARDAAEPLESAPLSLNSVVEVGLDDGFSLWLHPDTLKELTGQTARRDGADSPDTLEIPVAIPSAGPQRGIGDFAIRTLRIFGVDPVELSATALAKMIDQKIAPKPGLYCWGVDGQLAADTTTAPKSDKPILLFLHGTFSSTLGSFGGLAEVKHKMIWRALREAYGDQIYGLEHWTLSESPIHNAIQALEALPKNAVLHLVSHSRGGLIGELLCRGGGPAGWDAPFSPAEFALFPDQANDLRRLSKLLSEKRPRVERFVRVACPARGTTLAGEKLDVWLSLLANLLGLAPLPPGVAALRDLATAFALAVARERTNPRALPGLEAMIPDSAFQRMVNNRQATLDGDLRIIKGDVEGADGLLMRMAEFVADRFFAEEHDFVVNLGAMDGGAARLQKARTFFDYGPHVNHFNYFINERTAEKVRAALAGDDDGFEEIAEPKLRVVTAAARGRRDGERPVAFVVPGIMGSLLSVDGDEVWISPFKLAFGGFKSLRYREPGDGGPMVAPFGLPADYYEELVERLSATHKVIPFPYDWRAPIEKEAGRLETDLAAALAETTQPVRIVAHSMGGLLTRAALAGSRGLGKKMAARPGCRVVMLGTPNRGSYDIPMLLLGEERTARMLALLDMTASQEEHLDIIAKFPGVLDLLPDGDGGDYFSGALWRELFKAAGRAGPQLDMKALERAKAFRQRLIDTPYDPTLMTYVAGQALTIDGVEVEGGKVVVRRTLRGDGRVLWRTGAPNGVATYYAQAAHGDLPRDPAVLDAVGDLLRTGETRRLPLTAPTVRAAEPAALGGAEPITAFPNAADLAAAALGGRTGGGKKTRRYGAPIRIKVVHDNLGFARYPLLVGHYRGDTLAGAEKHLDQKLGGRLTRWRDLGLYPGDIGTAEVIIEGEPSTGAVIVGLGEAGALTVGDLQFALTRGLLRYAAVKSDGRNNDDITLNVSTLLIGSGTGGLSAADCVGALLRALSRVNKAVSGVRFGHVEIMELYESRAHQIWREIRIAIDDMAGDRADKRGAFVLDGLVRTGEGGRRRATDEEDRTWWQPMTITEEKRGDERWLNFIAATGAARAAGALMPAQRALVDQFIKEAIAWRGRDGGCTPGRALFELLLPAELKDASHADRPLRLTLDRASAHYPWELLDDRRPWTSDGACANGGEQRKPLAVRAPMVRQMIRSSVRRPLTASDGPKRALVIGDPWGGPTRPSVPLPGAVDEAFAVEGVLKANGFEVTTLVEDVSAFDVMMALCCQHWTVVHIAAHGDVDANDPRRSGVLLGGGVVLNADNLARLLPIAPDLVFLNCCHLGKVGDEPPPPPPHAAGWPALASSVAVELIDMGVNAVIAAGWAVDDGAAERFAEIFYRKLYGEKEGLGRAAWRARQHIYDNFENTNTWGAYQIYGEPDWRPAGPGEGQANESEDFASLAEAINFIECVGQDAQTGLVRDVEAQRLQLDKVERWATKYSLADDAQLLYALASAKAELGDLERAIADYNSALKSEASQVPLRAIEQLGNLSVRVALRENVPDAVKKAVEASLNKLETLSGLSGSDDGRGSAELNVLRGGCYKRLAQIEAGDNRTAALSEMHRYYKAAADKRVGKPEPYPLLMQATALVLLELRDGSEPANPERAAEIDRLLESGLKAAAERDGEEPTFWRGVALAEVKLLRSMRGKNLDKSNCQEIVDAYLKMWNRGGSRLKLNSVFEQLDFFYDVISDAHCDIDNLAGGLLDIREMLKKATR